jgi:hypoxanthine phosphoribosyltransferase
MIGSTKLAPRIDISAMSFQEAIDNSQQLAEEIEKHNFSPTAVVGIATGGLLPAKVVSNHLGCALIVISMARPLTSAKGWLGLSRLPHGIKQMLRRLEMALGLYRFMKNREISEVSGDVKPGRYVIVDDSLDTGNTMRVALEFLRDTANVPRSDVLLASITQIFDDASPPADVCLYRRTNFEFPWSQDSPEYAKFVSYCACEFPDR